MLDRDMLCKYISLVAVQDEATDLLCSLGTSGSGNGEWCPPKLVYWIGFGDVIQHEADHFNLIMQCCPVNWGFSIQCCWILVLDLLDEAVDNL